MGALTSPQTVPVTVPTRTPRLRTRYKVANRAQNEDRETPYTVRSPKAKHRRAAKLTCATQAP